MEEKADISILGCGWLGLPLAERLVAAGYTVKGSTTSADKLPLLEQKGIRAYQIHLQEDGQEENLANFLQAKVLLLNIPPHLRADGGEAYLKQMHRLLKALLHSPVNRLLFVSSTSVYPDLNRIVTEEDVVFAEEQQPVSQLLQAERLFQEREEWVTTIVRFGGLVGGNRQPGRFLAGKTNVPNGDAPVNLIHLDDCLAILQRLLTEQQWGQVLNACAPEHPLRKEFYTQAALALHLPPPGFQDMEKTSFKLINSQKLQDTLAYSFLHPDPMTFF